MIAVVAIPFKQLFVPIPQYSQIGAAHGEATRPTTSSSVPSKRSRTAATKLASSIVRVPFLITGSTAVSVRP